MLPSLLALLIKQLGVKTPDSVFGDIDQFPLSMVSDYPHESEPTVGHIHCSQPELPLIVSNLNPMTYRQV